MSANATTGRFSVASYSNASTTRKGAQTCLATVALVDGLEGASFLINSTGKYQAIYQWTVTWYMWCSSGTDLRYSEVAVMGNLYDNTTGKWVSGSYGNPYGVGGAPIIVVVARLSCSGPGSAQNSSGTNQSVSLHFNATLTGGDQYRWFAALYEYTDASARTICRNHVCSPQRGSDSADVGTHGRGAWLRSVRVF